MASIQTGIELQDNFTSVLYGIISSVNMAVSAMEDMQQSMNADIDTSGIEGARESINQTTAALDALNAAMESQTAPDIAPAAVPGDSSGEPIPVPVNPVLPDPLVENPDPVPLPIQPNAPPEPVEVPVQWQSDGLEVFTTTGYERFQQEVQSANNMLNTLNQTQAHIEQTANGLDLLPDAAVQDISNLGQRLQTVQQRIQEISSDPVNAVSEDSNAQLEQLRGQLDGLIQQQNELNTAMESGDISDINVAYLQLSQNLNNTERFIRDNTDEQGRFNRAVDEATEGMGGLESAVQKVVAAIGGMFAIQKVVGFINECTDAADIQINAQRQLASTLSNMGGTESDYNALVKKAQDIQAAGMYGDEALIGAAAEFATYMNDTTAIEMMMDTLTNYAAGMSGGGAIDYDSMVDYATNLGKITTGAYDAMTKKGFEFTEAQKAVIDGTATESQYVEALGADWEAMSEDMRSATIIAEIINESWDGLYETMSDTPEAQLQSLKNSFGDIQEMVGNRLYPTLGNLYSIIIANLPLIESVMMSAANGLGVIINILSYIVQGIGEVAAFVQENWSVISPVIYGIIGALAAYVAYLGIVKAAEVIGAAIKIAMCLASYAHAAATGTEASATAVATAAQYGLNTALLACPLTWIILAIVALIAVVIAVANYIANLGGTATTAFGVICGGVNVVIQFFKNLGLMVANIALGIGNAIAAVASNIMTAFHNAICSVQAWWYDLLSTVLNVVAGICEALNKLPFVEFDYSGITSAADEYAAKSAEAAGNKDDYKSISDAFNKGFNTFDAFGDGWVSDAYAAGAAWGDGISNKVSDMFTPDDTTDYLSGMGDIFADNVAGGLDNSDMAGSLGDISGDTSNISDALDITEEDLKYLRDIAEQEAVNRFTTAEIKVDMTNHNNINNGMDLDGVVSGLTDGVNEAIETMAEGVHD
ncbi:MAG: hypothetical protein NC489_13625 [Ruminococcus flavefaciens]|nr:hypothetical protein [Ruminococcus flavefaciens]